MNHSFDVDVAVEYGIPAAILLNHFCFWIAKNKANGVNFYDGCYWTYNTRKAYAELFPYMTERQIRSAIEKLVNAGIVKTGRYNKDIRDRTLWYALTENGFRIVQKCQLEMTPMSVGSDADVRPLPDNNTTDKNNIYLDGFNAFYSAYPRHIDKRQSFEQWKKLKPDKALRDRIISDVKHRIDGEWKGREEKYIPYPSRYLKQRPWEDEPIEIEQVNNDDDPTMGPYGKWTDY